MTDPIDFPNKREPTKEELLMINFREALVKHARLQAQAAKIYYDALVAVGFAEVDALQICTKCLKF